jgi:dihydrofolate synthase/folylpolyglutamate synthase
MNDTFQTTLQYLYDLQFFGMKLGLDNIRELLKHLGDPHRSFPAIHIAGTNGKGSTSAMLESIFRAAGYRTGLYTSPHLFRFGERIRINGVPISEEEIVTLTQKMKNKIDELKCTFFEATTAMSFEYFRNQTIDIGIIETGLGGRLDATNVIEPIVSIITNIGLEHTEHLGNTISAIAFEKAGIIKPKAPCVVGRVDREARVVFERTSSELHSSIYFLDRISSIAKSELNIDGSNIDLNLQIGDMKIHFNKLKIGLAGKYQLDNAALAVAATLIQKRFKVNESDIRSGLSEVRWNARLEVIHKEPFIICDAAHNPAGLRALVESITEIYKPRFGKLFLIIGMLSDKNYKEAAKTVAPHFDEVCAVTPQSERALKAEQLAEIFRRIHPSVSEGNSVVQAVNSVKEKMSPNDLLIVTGSHFVLSELRDFMRVS